MRSSPKYSNSSRAHFRRAILIVRLTIPLVGACADILGFEDGRPYPPDEGDGSTDDASDSSTDATTPPDGRAQPDSGDAQMPEDPDVVHDAGLEADASKCGNGSIDPGEECDDGISQNTGGYGKCNPNCTLGPRCGDGMINGPNEACDNGPDNGLGLGACNPGCTGLVGQKALKIYNSYDWGGALTGDWDAMCKGTFGAGYLGLVVDGVTRIASQTPYEGDGQLNWILRPYTRYINDTGTLVWTTDGVSLLGVRNGMSAPLINTLASSGTDFAWLGINDDWTTSTSSCNQWTKSDASAVGTGLRLTANAIQTMLATCDMPGRVICVEQ